MPRTITTSHSSSATSRPRTAMAPEIRLTIRVTGAKATSWPRTENARSRRSACHPPVEPITATRMLTLLIDNYDSYTFNLFHLIGEVNEEEPIVVRNDELTWPEIVAMAPDNIVISPGPGRPEHPRDVGLSLDALREADVPVLGVCLGHQALAYVSGGTVEHAPEVVHGRRSRIHHDGSVLFAGIPQGFP